MELEPHHPSLEKFLLVRRYCCSWIHLVHYLDSEILKSLILLDPLEPKLPLLTVEQMSPCTSKREVFIVKDKCPNTSTTQYFCLERLWVRSATHTKYTNSAFLIHTMLYYLWYDSLLWMICSCVGDTELASYPGSSWVRGYTKPHSFLVTQQNLLFTQDSNMFLLH